VLKNIAYDPSSVTIKAGEAVEWRWQDGDTPHNVDFGDTKSGDPKTTGTFTRSFSAGQFRYHCDVHPSMQGSVEVS
jgi:plastocyanin